MGRDSAIEWTDHTFNPWIGCTKVAPGCAHCYAESFARRYKKAAWGPEGTRVKTSESYWREPLKWNRQAEGAGRRPRVFCASLADVFEDWQGPIVSGRGEHLRWNRAHGVGPWLGMGAFARNATMDDLRRDLFALVDSTPNLDWLILTKRPENIRRMWCSLQFIDERGSRWGSGEPFRARSVFRGNVWLLTSVAEQADADRNVPELLTCRDLVPVLGLSCEPLLGPLALDSWLSALDWLIVGGESGPGARPMHPDWARAIRDQCAHSGVPFFFKQWGEWHPRGGDGFLRELVRFSDEQGEPHHAMFRVGKKRAGRQLDGCEHSEFPRLAVEVR